MDIQQIQYFIEVAGTGSFSEAAENLFTSQSSVSKNIKALEKELNIQLFDRSKRQISLTQAGHIVLEDAMSIFQVYSQMLHTIKNYQNEQNDTLSIVSIPVMAQYNITGLLADFQNTYPNISLNIEELEGAQILSMLKEHTIDFAYMRLEALEDSYNYVPVFQDHLAVVLPKTHRLSNRESISISELKQENFLLLNKGTLLFDLSVHECNKKGFQPNIVYTGTRIENILELVGKGRGISLMMQHAVSYTHNTNTIILPLQEDISSTIALICAKEKVFTSTEKIFWNYMKQYKYANQNL